MRTLDEFIEQSCKFAVARQLLEYDANRRHYTQLVPVSELDMSDPRVCKEELEEVDTLLDTWVWLSPFKSYRGSGGHVSYKEHENNHSPFHGSFHTQVVAVSETSGTVYVIDNQDNSIILELSLDEVAPDNDYDELKEELEEIVKNSRRDNSWLKQQGYSWA